MSLFTNPHQWAASMVATKARFWVFAIALSAFLALLVEIAATSGVRAAWGLAIFIGAFQIGMLYALRQILTGPPKPWH
ncbi:MAG: hypothetical protein ACM3SO_09665 [Betaproteobacteria bacterium]